jgi:DNA-3-methyladenine glycosylase
VLVTAVPLGRDFFARDATEVARDLVGKLLVRHDEGLSARIVETEAYTQEDPACHAYRRRTERNDPLFGPPGHAYVYFTYGMHWCLNVATGRDGHAQGCLLRAAEPLTGLDRMRARHGGRRDRELLRGPARLAQAYGLDGAWSGWDVCAHPDPAHPLGFADDGDRPRVVVTPRTGVSLGADLPWRFVADDTAWASPYKRHRRAGTGQAVGYPDRP